MNLKLTLSRSQDVEEVAVVAEDVAVVHIKRSHHQLSRSLLLKMKRLFQHQSQLVEEAGVEVVAVVAQLFCRLMTFQLSQKNQTSRFQTLNLSKQWLVEDEVEGEVVVGVLLMLRTVSQFL